MMNSRFTYTQAEQEGVLIFKLKGSLDIGTVSGVKAGIDTLLATGQHKVVFDLGELDQIDSSGVGAIIAIFKRVKLNKGEMKIAQLVGQPKEIFMLLRLNQVFELYDEVDKAVNSFR
jgi:anti-sigma B factor antagonist